MSQTKNNWGFPRWSEYRTERGASEIKMCDFHGCEEKGEHPAPKSPHTEEKWWFCGDHAAEYNKGWNFFEGMKDEEAKAYAKAERQKSGSYAKADAWGWVSSAGLRRCRTRRVRRGDHPPPHFIIRHSTFCIPMGIPPAVLLRRPKATARCRSRRG